MKVGFDATGEVVVITGGAHGIGAALAKAVARHGGTAVVFDIATSSLAGTPGIELVEVDVADREAVLKAVGTVIERHGRIDGLVAGAAVQPRAAVLDTAPADWTRVLKVNLDGVGADHFRQDAGGRGGRAPGPGERDRARRDRHRPVP
jgi:NAD(P)-dependent dehydrogenase (short-subunit alcohol dehydrogenase family)